MRDCAAGKHRDSEICGTITGDFRPAATFSFGVCGTRGYEPGWVDAAVGARRSGARLRARGLGDSTRTQAAEITKNTVHMNVAARNDTDGRFDLVEMRNNPGEVQDPR